MNNKLLKGWSILIASALFVACDSDDTSDEGSSASSVDEQVEETGGEDHSDHDEDPGQNSPEDVGIEGLADHYHTGDSIELVANFDEDVDYDHWHWYTRADHNSEWQSVPDHGTEHYSGEATHDGQEIKAVLFDADHEAYVQSPSVEVVIDDHDHDHDHAHSHAHDEESQRIYDGFFYNDDVKDRSLSDWSGEWQSVYPYLVDGTLDEVFEHKADEEGNDMSAEEYKDYYEVGYETDVDQIVIGDDSFTFYENDEESTANYEYDGYEILTYDAGNRGVRFIFEKVDGDEAMPEYIQFSDHEIAPTDSHHFHLYWGDDREDLLDEVTNWPTYYPTDLNEEDIVHEMIAH
ncbi:metal-binding protein ZinT [Geomicrobium sp. JSM 1781026]|uniref:metal-binding protein ZinT n=1 Tax=Geomicrobium sp. JSM 1781026 TaxID=3344580 RepID=UPI0035C10135